MNKNNTTRISCSHVHLFNNFGCFMINMIKLNGHMGFYSQSFEEGLSLRILQIITYIYIMKEIESFKIFTSEESAMAVIEMEN